MRLIDLGGVYLLAGAIVTWALRARRPQAGAVRWPDAVLAFVLWPLYAPTLAGSSPRAPSASPRTERERMLLEQAIAAARTRLGHGTLTALLPTAEQLATLAERLARLDARVDELDQVLAHDDFDVVRAERRLRDADRASAASATAAIDGARRLTAMRERAVRERDELLGLCARLRMQVTVLRFADGAGDPNLAEVVGEILTRVEGVGDALDPGVRSSP